MLAMTALPAVGQHSRQFIPDGATDAAAVRHVNAPASIHLMPGDAIRAARQIKRVEARSAGVNEYPFTEDFADGLGGFTAVDANGDGVTWAPSAGSVRTNASNGAGDDWLMSPAFNFEVGREYRLTYTLKAWSSTYNEKIEVKYGSGTTAGDMTVEILPATDVKSYTNSTSTAVDVSHEFTVAETGDYHIGIRSFGGEAYGTGAARYYNYIDNFKLELLALPVAPEAVADLSVESGAGGVLSATITFTVPDKAVDGSELLSVSKVELLRGGELIKTFDNVTPGQAVSYVDAEPAAGFNTYTVIAYGGAGKGAPTEVEVFVGADIPGLVGASLYDDSGASLLAVWEPVTQKGENGGYVDPSAVSYVIGEYVEPVNFWEPYTVRELWTTEPGATSYDIGIVPDEGEQTFVEYVISAKNAQGQGEYSYISPTALKVVGAPYTLPFGETFAGASMQDRFWIMSLADPYTSNSFYISPKDSYDKAAGSGCISWTPIFDDETASLITGKISIADAGNPVLFVATKGSAGSKARLTVAAQTVAGTVETLKTVDFSESPTGEWIQLQIPLGALKSSRYVHIVFVINADKNDGPVLMDDIHVIDLKDVNAAVAIDVPRMVTAGQPATVNVTVANLGKEILSSCRVEVKAGGEVIYDGALDKALATLESAVVPVVYTPSVFVSAGELPVTAAVYAEGDMQASDNTAEGVIEILAAPDFAVSDLSAESGDGAVTLKWTAMTEFRQEITESFETYRHGSISELGGWQSVDRDGGLAGGINGYPLPHDEEAYSFMVLDPEQVKLGDDPSFEAHSGRQYLIASYVYDGVDSYVDCDDWLVSPVLSGKAQTMSFWVNSYDGDETYEVLYSATDNKPESFVKLTQGTVDMAWEEVTVDLPEGARYFAIRRTTDGYTAFYMMIDDITYMSPVAVDHYNIYVDGKFVGSTEGAEFTVPCDDYEQHVYGVTTVSAEGVESSPATITVSLSGVGAIVADGELYDVYTVSGIELMRGAKTLDGLAPGVYVINGKKVAVK